MEPNMKNRKVILAALIAASVVPSGANAQSYHRERDSGVAGLGLCSTWSAVLHPFPCFWLLFPQR